MINKLQWVAITRLRRAATRGFALAHLRLAAVLAGAMLLAFGGGAARARPAARAAPAPASLTPATLLLRTSDVPGLVKYEASSGALSLWESAERENGQRRALRQNRWLGGALRTFGQSPTSLYGVLVVESRAFIFADATGARAAFNGLAPSGLHRVAGTLPALGGGQIYAHLDSINGVAELALAVQFRQANVISRVMIVGTPGTITRANLDATSLRQAARVAQALTA